MTGRPDSRFTLTARLPGPGPRPAVVERRCWPPRQLGFSPHFQCLPAGSSGSLQTRPQLGQAQHLRWGGGLGRGRQAVASHPLGRPGWGALRHSSRGPARLASLGASAAAGVASEDSTWLLRAARRLVQGHAVGAGPRQASTEGRGAAPLAPTGFKEGFPRPPAAECVSLDPRHPPRQRQARPRH